MINSKDKLINAVNQIIDDLFIKDEYGGRLKVNNQMKLKILNHFQKKLRLKLEIKLIAATAM